MTEAETLSKGQQRGLDDAVDGKNIFITGGGGVGKSHLVHNIKDKLEEMGREVAITSSTGISAINIGGSTIHSFLGTGALSNIRSVKKLPVDNLMRTRIYSGGFDTIVVDEVSMLHGDYIDMLDFRLKKIYKSQRPFGGRQVIFVGDFLQLPSVITEDDSVACKYAFQSQAWNLYGIREHFLTHVFRQDNKETQYYLNCIRFGKINKDVLDYFNSRVGAEIDDPDPTELYPLKSSVTSVNFNKLHKLDGKEYEYEAVFSGEDKWQQALAKSTIADVCLYLKVGAPVLFIKNNPEAGYYNGMKGVVVDCGEGHVTVETLDGEEITVSKSSWEKKDNRGKVLATMKQIPLILGWAVTIHKSQGMTLEYMKCDLSLCFEYGQAYVALSRMKSMEGLSISKPISKRDIKTDRTVVNYYRNLLTRLKEQKAAGQ